MKLLKQVSNDCLLYAAAMLLDEEPIRLAAEIGHDGKEKLWPELAVPRCYRGYHIEEIIDCFIRRGKTLTPIHPELISSPYDDGKKAASILKYEEAQARFNTYMGNFDAILIVQTNFGHAVAWNHAEGLVYDPNGFYKSIEDYIVSEAWIKTDLI